jgi:hypothetical protein
MPTNTSGAAPLRQFIELPPHVLAGNLLVFRLG